MITATTKNLQILRKLNASAPALATITIQGLNSLSNLGISWFLIRRIGVSGFGYYALYLMIAVNISTIAGALLLQPLNSIASRYSDQRQNDFIYAAFIGQILLVGVMLVIAVIAAAFVACFDMELLLNIIVGSVFSITMTIGEFFRRIAFFQRNVLTVLVYDFTRLSLVILTFVVSPNKVNAETYTLAIALGYLVALIAIIPAVSAVFYKKNMYFKIVYGRIRRLFKSGMHNTVSTSLRLINTQGAIFVSFFVLGAYEAGLIRVAQTIVGLTNPATQAMEHIIPVNLGRKIREVGFSTALSDFRKQSITVICGFALLYALITVFSPFLISLTKIEPTPYLFCLIGGVGISYLLMVITSCIIFALRACEQGRALSLTAVITASISAVFSYPAVLYGGILGVIAAIVIPQVVGIILLAVVFLRHPYKLRPVTN